MERNFGVRGRLDPPPPTALRWLLPDREALEVEPVDKGAAVTETVEAAVGDIPASEELENKFANWEPIWE